MEPPPITLIKSKNYEKPDKYCVKIKLRRDTTSQKSDLYEFKMALFDNSEPEEFLLFVSNFSMNPEAPVTLADGVKIQYLPTLVCGELLLQFDTLSAEVGSTTPENFTSIILGLVTHFFLLRTHRRHP